MCGITGFVHFKAEKSLQPVMLDRLQRMNSRIKHRGPDGEGIWIDDSSEVGLAHQRLSIIETSDAGIQPMSFYDRYVITYNGEIYNYIELKAELSHEFSFTNKSDTEVILAAYAKWGTKCPDRLRGMFAFAIWDKKEKVLFAARDRFGIKPFYYTQCDDVWYFASECKALLFLQNNRSIHVDGFKDYLAFQFCLAGKTLFNNIYELKPGHFIEIAHQKITITKYWEVHYIPDFDHSNKYFEEKLSALLYDSVKVHLRSDVPIGAYVSGGLDSSTIASIAKRNHSEEFLGFTGKFSFSKDYDESSYAQLLAKQENFTVHEVDICEDDFINYIPKVIYHLDYPVAGPGSFPQFVVSKLASKYRKVLLGGQGGDEIFGGYTRYLIAYFEQCIKGAIEGNLQNKNFVVTYESIIPNLVALKNYKPMLTEFWKDGLFEEMDKRYFRLINRAPHLGDAVHWESLGDYSPFDTFKHIFHGDNVSKQSYFDLMTHFDFKTLLPALLQVEDRMSMANGLESRVPLLDHHIVEFAATIPANIKFENGDLKHIFKRVISNIIPPEILNRKDKMGFPTPIVEWSKKGRVKEFIQDIFHSAKAQQREYIDNKKVLEKISNETKFGRNLWGFLCLELWQQEFFDNRTDEQN
ncbi:MAG: asparagine synthase (glutamine-hydrolyzing) [Bacteroidota bacterium]|nr:asparagine synthase (glutamine-hydrolyzing) [Bacteroidota bacterium]